MDLKTVGKHPAFRYFMALSQIPRKSFCEEKAADFVENFARVQGLWYIRDGLGNLILKKPGSSGREGEPPLILQAHLDKERMEIESYVRTYEYLKDILAEA